VSDQRWIDLAVAVVALVVMALAAMVAAVAGRIGRQRLRHLGDQHGRHRSVQALLDPQRSLAAALALVQVIAVGVAASLLTGVVARAVGTAEHALAVVAVALVYLVFGQALPRAFAAAQPDRAGRVMLALAGVFQVVAAPLVAVGDALAAGFARLLGVDADAASEDELRAAIEPPADGIIEPEEREMIDAVLELEDTPVREIMVPRVDIVAVPEDASAAEIVATVTRAGHSRVPVYRESIDQVVGILYAKDLLPFVIGATEILPLARLVRPAYVVPESKRIDDLLAELRLNRVHIAVVVDEYGGTAGLVTIEDILETIVGDIQDEYDLEPVLLEVTGPGQVVADGSIPLHELEDALALDLQDPEDEVATAAGWVHLHLERLPEVGDEFDADGVRAEVLSMEGHRLRRLRVTRLDAIPPDPLPLLSAGDEDESAGGAPGDEGPRTPGSLTGGPDAGPTAHEANRPAGALDGEGERAGPPASPP
jgi:CBS domain containing-hemolysin-like protein